MCYEQFSYEDIPSASICASDVVLSFLSKKNSYNQKYGYINEDDIYRIVKRKIELNPPKYSLAAWYCGGINDYLELSLEFLKNIKIKLYRKINYLRACGIFIIIYRNTLERLYAPGGEFESKMSKYWNPLLKNSDLHLPKPPNKVLNKFNNYPPCKK